MTLQEMQEARADLYAALVSGVYSVRHKDRTVTYQSFAQMKAALAQLDRDIATAAGRPSKRRAFAISGKGL